MISERKLRERVENLKRQVAIYEDLLNNNETAELGRPLGQTEYTTEELQFLESCNKEGMTDREIIAAWNLKYNDNIPLDSRQLYNLMVRQGIINPNFRKEFSDNAIRNVKMKSKREEPLIKTPSKIKFIRAYQNLKWSELLPLFNKTFGTTYEYPTASLYQLKLRALKSSGQDSKIKKVRGRSKIKINPENEIRVLKTYFLGTPFEKKQLEEEFGLKHNDFTKKINVYKIKNMDRLNPRDIGLIRFPKNASEYANIEPLKIESKIEEESSITITPPQPPYFSN